MIDDQDYKNRDTENKNPKSLEQADSQFLQGVYHKIEVLQEEEKELEIIRQTRLNILKKRVRLFVIALLLNMPFLALLPDMIYQDNQTLIFTWSFLLMISGSFVQYRSENRERC